MRIAIAQYNPTVGDLRGNMERLLAAAANARDQGVDLLVAPELALTGYPPRDLLDRPPFVQDSLQALEQLVSQAPIPMLVGAVVSAEPDPLRVHSKISNGAVLAHAGRIIACHRKNLLPSYDVFDEVRYFTPGDQATVATVRGVRLGISVCEDIWNDKEYWTFRRYDRDPVADEIAQGADLLINISASPYDRGKPEQRLTMLQALVRRHKKPLLYVNQVGGDDSLLFDGRSLALDQDGNTTLAAPAFREVMSIGRLEPSGILQGDSAADPSCWQEEVVDGLCMGLRDYLRKCSFDKVVVGLSGGIDSALTAALAVRAIGASRVIGVAMPAKYSSDHSLTDAQDLAKRLGIRCDVVPIEGLFQGFLEALGPSFTGLPQDVTEENLQARIRGTLLMAFSNKLSALLLTTGNKSEVAVGYCTLYGDMNGGLSLLSDLYKTEVYAVSRYLNTLPGAPIPENSITKPPSAELRPGQTDQDSLPPYELLDAILKGYVEEAASPAALASRGHPADIVGRITTLVDRSEHKRRQMAPGLRVSRKAFGEGRRMPVAQRYSSK